MKRPLDPLNAARAHLSRGELDLAVRAFREALRERDELDAREGLGQALAKAGRYEEALAELEQVCAREPSRESALRARGEVLMRLGRFEQGVDDLRRAMDSGRMKRQGP